MFLVQMQMKSPPVNLPHVVHVLQHQKVALQLAQLLVLDPRERRNRHSVVNIEPKCIEWVIDDDYLTQISVEDSKVFDVWKFLAVKVAVWAIEPMLDILLFWVDMLQNVVSVALDGWGKNHDVVSLG